MKPFLRVCAAVCILNAPAAWGEWSVKEGRQCPPEVDFSAGSEPVQVVPLDQPPGATDRVVLPPEKGDVRLRKDLRTLHAQFANAQDVRERKARAFDMARVLRADFDQRMKLIGHRRPPTCVEFLREQLDEAAADIVVLRQLERMLPGLGGDALENLIHLDNMALLSERYETGAKRVAMLSNQYGLYVGTAFSLAAAGTWEPGVEAMARFEKEATSDSGLCPAFLWCRLLTDISYETIGALDRVTETTDSGDGGLGGVGNTATNTPTDSPFLKKAAYFRVNVAAKAHFNDWLGLQLGAGISSLPDSSLKVTKTAPRGFLGLTSNTIYGDGALGEMFVGYAYDEFWEVHSSQRYVADGVFMIPGLRPRGFSVAVRMFADGPVDGTGPSEVRASLLFYQPFSDWAGLLNPARALSLGGPAGALLNSGLGAVQ